MGIPANQRSWVENAIRGVFTRTHDPYLAPAMKSLWPSSYKETSKGFTEERSREIEAMPLRPRPEHRLDWQAATKTFVLSHKGAEKILTTDQVKGLFRGEPIEITETSIEIEEKANDVPPEVEDLRNAELDLEKAADRTEPTGQLTVPDADNDENDQPVAANAEEAKNEIDGPTLEEIKCDSEETPDATKSLEDSPLELPAHVQALLDGYNALGKSLGFPEITPDMYAKAQHPALANRASNRRSR